MKECVVVSTIGVLVTPLVWRWTFQCVQWGIDAANMSYPVVGPNNFTRPGGLTPYVIAFGVSVVWVVLLALWVSEWYEALKRERIHSGNQKSN